MGRQDLYEAFEDVLKWHVPDDAVQTISMELADRFSHWQTVYDNVIGEVDLWWVP